MVANTGLTWDDVIDMSPLRLKFVANAVKRRRASDTLSIFDAQAALIDEKSLNRLNREFEGRSKVKEKFLFGWRNKNIKDSTLGMLENII